MNICIVCLLDKLSEFINFEIKTLDNQIITIKTFDEIADIAYCNLDKEKTVFVYGKLRENYVEAKK